MHHMIECPKCYREFETQKAMDQVRGQPSAQRSLTDRYLARWRKFECGRESGSEKSMNQAHVPRSIRRTPANYSIALRRKAPLLRVH
jgi:hypothetical protein